MKNFSSPKYLAIPLILLAIGLLHNQKPLLADELLSVAGASEKKEEPTFIDKLKPLDVNKEENVNPKDTEKSNEPITVYEDETAEDIESRVGQAKVYLTISVPHNKRAIDTVVAFPHPPKPPKQDWHPPLPENEKEIKQLLIGHGYLGRASTDQPYPPGGWRFQYAFAKSIKNSKMSVPHTIFEHYGWADKMLEFILPEFIKINDFEKKRDEAYKKYQSFYADNISVLRNRALRNNVDEIKFAPLPKERKKHGVNFGGVLPDGKWWIQATHKIPGLTYHWIKEMDLKNGDREIVELTEANALAIGGGW